MKITVVKAFGAGALALVGGLLSACATNRLDRQGERTGRWRTHYDEARHQPQSRGRYRHDQPRGHWRYYSQAGKLEREERFRPNGTSILTYYHPNGRVWRRGLSRLTDNGRTLHYYWTGDWLIYSETGALEEVETYAMGKLVHSRPAGQ